MASAPTPDNHKNRGNIPKSHFKQTVCLSGWWLVKTENDFQGRRLAVAGFTCRENQAMRVFSSAPILKRDDIFTIETTDGICVIFKGFINKARTLENGFPSDVYNHFVFGFPSYWKEYEEDFMDENGQPHVGNCKKDLGSQRKIDVEGMRKSKKTKSSAVSLPNKSYSVISGSEYNIIMPCITPEGLENESYSGGHTVEDQATLNVHVNCRKNKMELLSDPSVGGKFNISAVTDEVVADSQVDATRGILLACRNRSTDNLRKVELDKRNSMKANSDKDMSSSQEILSRTDGRVRTRSMSSSKIKQNDKKSAKISGEKMRLNCVSSMGFETVELTSVDCEPEGRNNPGFEVFELHGRTDKIKLSEFEAGSVRDEFVLIPRIPIWDNDLRKVKTKGNTKKEKTKATSSMGTLAAADNEENVIPDRHNFSENAKSSDMKTRRKLAYETPDLEKERVCASPHCTSFKRSRSGRLLMPTLEFWRNQRAIYDVVVLNFYDMITSLLIYPL